MLTATCDAAPATTSFARTLRLRRLYRHSGRLFVVPLDHAIATGPIAPDGGIDALVRAVTETDVVDAVVLHKGCLRRIDPDRFRTTALIVHLSASTDRATDPDAKYLVTGVEEALRMGADAVSVHVNLGSRDERQQIIDLGTVSDLCDRWNLPLLAMVYPRGPKASPADAAAVEHAVTLAAELGADIVKTVYPGSPEAMRRIARRAGIPVLMAGGPPCEDLYTQVGRALDGGAAGVAIGRNIIQADDVAATTRKLGDLVHGWFESPARETETGR
jgi:2-amino-4,5-dihydroxy-6-oxo-7-(phosphooxy)heptanoate synthase